MGSVHFVDLRFFLFTLVGSVHFVDNGLDPPWGPSTLWIYFKFVTLVGSIHFVDCGLDPRWGPSILWTCLGLWPWLVLSILWTGLDPPWGLSTLWICLSLWPWLGPSTLWTVVLTLRGVRPLCGLIEVFYPCRVRPRCGLGSWPLVGSVHFVDYLSFLPLSSPSTLWTGVLTLGWVRPL